MLAIWDEVEEDLSVKAGTSTGFLDDEGKERLCLVWVGIDPYSP